MSDFVQQCRREWKRLRVPDSLADEMAADLTSDIDEAQAEGISLEELLGSSAFDPQSFAASWASERGIIPVPAADGDSHRRPAALVAFTVAAVITVLVAALLLVTGQPKMALVATRTSHAALVVPPFHGPGPGDILRARTSVSASAAAPIEWMLLFLAILALGFAAWLWSGHGRTRAPRLSG
jgi:hypothetical protein